MRRICFLFCCILMFVALIGCSSRDKDIQQPINFYYINKDISYNTPDGVICAEVHEGSKFQNFDDLFRAYLNGPITSELQTFIPTNVSLISCTIEGSTVQLLLSEQFAELSGVKLAIVGSAILLTANEYMDAQTISIQAVNCQLDDKDAYILTMDDVILMDTVVSETVKE